MERRSVTKYTLPAALLFLTAIPVIMAAARSVQIPLGTIPEDTMRLMSTHISLWLHVVAGVGFGLIGPIQFGRVLANRFGRLHKILGRIFVVSGLFLAFSGSKLVWSHHGQSTPALDITRIVAGFGLVFALGRSMYQIFNKNIPRHRAWIIRAYAVGMGSSGVAFILFPIYIVTGEFSLQFSHMCQCPVDFVVDRIACKNPSIGSDHPSGVITILVLVLMSMNRAKSALNAPAALGQAFHASS